MKCSLHNSAAFVDPWFLWKPQSGSSQCIATQITCISSSVGFEDPAVTWGWYTCTFYSLPWGQVSTCLFVFAPYLCNSLFCAGEPENNRQQLQRHKKPRSVPPLPALWQQPHPQKANYEKKNKKSDDRHLFLFHATETPFRGGHSRWRREERLLSDAAAVIGFLNATPRTMRLLSRPAIGNLCATAAAWKHPAHVHVHTHTSAEVLHAQKQTRNGGDAGKGKFVLQSCK